MSQPSHARRVVMVADQPLDPVGEGGVVADTQSALWVVSVPVTLFQRMSMPGWWPAASAASATGLSNRVADPKWS
jgi:hypothetical protein